MSQGAFSSCLPITLTEEGGYVDNPKDPGGETNYGVTVAVARAYGYTGPMRSIPMSVVEQIYRDKYWQSSSGNCEGLKAGVDLAVFDFGVHSGPARAWKYLESAVGGSAVETVKKLCAARLKFLQGLKIWSWAGKGFARRVAGIEAKGVKMALAAEGKAPAEIKKDLQAEQTAAEKSRNNNGKIAGGTAAGGAATQTPTEAPTPHVDPTGFDWHILLYVGLSAAALIAAFFIYRAFVQHHRAVAYAAAAKEA